MEADKDDDREIEENFKPHTICVITIIDFVLCFLLFFSILRHSQAD